MTELEKLTQCKINAVPPTVYYIPDFITEAEEVYLLHRIESSPKPKWTQLSNRRLQNWGGLPHPKGMLSEKLPEWLEQICGRVSDLGAFGDKRANHVLVNEYQPGQGIMPHEDGPLYYPTVSNLTIGSHSVLKFYHPVADEKSSPCIIQAVGNHAEPLQQTPLDSSFDSRHFASMLLERRSLFLMQDDMYTKYLHGIDELASDTIDEKSVNIDRCQSNVGDTLERSVRVSLTIRHVPNVLKTKIFIGLRR
ncbi:Fe2OG dioxygenase domain-containing protein [Lamellibrachia satsuma]|nr:Fe2OG dioxygenase domain-containing protein [Lamellibrachia satsuma]